LFTEIILNIQPLEKRMALLEDNQLVELYVEKVKHTNFVGNIYKGIVKDVVPGLGAAFIDIGLERTAFLHHSDFTEVYTEDMDEGDDQPKKKTKPSTAKISDLLKTGDEVVVQIQKGPIGSKGARLIKQISIPGKFLVFKPHQTKIAISRKMNSAKERNRIRTILKAVKAPQVGLIVRTDAENCTEEDLLEEYNMLFQSWQFLEKLIITAKAPCCVFDESDIMSIIVRDIFSSKIDRLVVDDRQFYTQICQRLSDYNEALSQRCELYKEETPLFDTYNIEKEIEKIFHSRIYLPSGGNIVIEPTEALVAVDVNTGSFTKSLNFQDTIKKTNMEAAKEIARQIRLRNHSGIVIIDFIDMKEDSSRQAVIDVLRSAFKRDRAKYKIHNFSPLGLVEMSRKRSRSSLIQTYFEHCKYCHGTGRTMTRHAVLFQINRWLHRSEFFIAGQELDIYVNPVVKASYTNHKDILSPGNRTIHVYEDSTLPSDKYRILLTKEKKDITNKFIT